MKCVVAAAPIVLVALVLSTGAPAEVSAPSACITVKALGCYLKLPADVLLIADASGEGTLLSLGGKGQFRFLPRTPERQKLLSEHARMTRDHLEVIEYDQPGEREPLRMIVIRSKDQQLELTGAARRYSDLVVDSCLSGVSPAMQIFRSLSKCSSEPLLESRR